MKKLMIGMFVLLLVGCATPYTPNGVIGGYSDVQLNENTFKVTTKGNGYTSKDRVFELNLLRASYLTVENNFKYFLIADANTDVSSATFVTPTTTTFNAYSYGGYTNGTINSYGGIPITARFPTATFIIQCFSEKPESSPRIFDAQLIIKNLKPKYIQE